MKIIKTILLFIIISAVFTALLYYAAGFNITDALFIAIFSTLLSQAIPDVLKLAKQNNRQQDKQ
jgi:hypothetical protein